MKKLSDFKENKVELNDVNGGRIDWGAFSMVGVNHAPGGTSTPGNYLSMISTDINGAWVHTELEPGLYPAAPRP
ncbi:hypothetical protein [Algibacter lectus]|uniref:hypothetical protein n=1 Tax=Algibacter lectus TaxID=221126 RepID=UPI0026F0FB77|nr:hypothetical protein [Algibacter lectus]MDO7135440.1 hypothetical protein [Algibacter lectus]